ncbi:putative integral membrane protein [Cryptosporidium felis]|nr:putative integral membrane protein [Cryptosporidium felis]
MLSASEYFASYEEEFLSLIQVIEKIVLKCASFDEGGRNEHLTRDEISILERKFQEAKRCLDQLGDEAVTLSKKSVEYQSYQRYQGVYSNIHRRFEIIREESSEGSYYFQKEPDLSLKVKSGNDNQHYLMPPTKEYNMGVSTEDLMKRNEDNLKISAQLAQETHHVGLYSLNTLTVQRDNLTRKPQTNKYTV